VHGLLDGRVPDGLGAGITTVLGAGTTVTVAGAGVTTVGAGTTVTDFGAGAGCT
jgi:hypothetical protein